MKRFLTSTITLVAAAALLLPPGAAAQDRGLARHLDRAAHRARGPRPQRPGDGRASAGLHFGSAHAHGRGNAADAAVATLATLNVVRPQMSGMAGNGFVTIYDRVSDRVYSLGATGAAPLAIDPASRTADELNKGIHAGVVPGLFGGWIALLDRFGTMSLDQVLAPAIDYAENGHPIEPSVVASIESHKELFESFPSSRRMFLPLGRVPEPARTSACPIWRTRSGRLSRPNRWRWRPGSRARTRSRPPSTASTGATSPRRWRASTARTAATSPWRTSRATSPSGRNRCTPPTGATTCTPVHRRPGAVSR